MSTSEIIKEIKTLPLGEQKAVLRVLSEGLEEDFDARLYDERSKEPDGLNLVEILSSLKRPA